MQKKRILLHACCAPCSTTAIFSLASEYDITLCFYNPNIYPEEEFKKRKNEIYKLVKAVNFDGLDVKILDIEDDFKIYEKAILGYENEKEGGARCNICFAIRLDKVALLAKENGFDCFATTLTVSPHKNAKLINEIGENVSKKHKIEYLPTDFKKKDGFKKSIELSKKYDLYRQNYCGCKYSIWF